MIFCLTHNYTGYPMVRQAKAMVADGQLGHDPTRSGGICSGRQSRRKQARSVCIVAGNSIPVRGGPSLVMGDIGSHAHNLVRFITGLEVAEVAAEIGNIVPNRAVHDYGGALLRFENGARGSYWVTQAAAGVENCLRIRVSGTKGSLEWMQEFPQALTFKPLGAPSQNRTPNGPGTLPLSKHSSRIVAGHPEGFHEGFANIYSDAAEAIAARRAGKEAESIGALFPEFIRWVDGRYDL